MSTVDLRSFSIKCRLANPDLGRRLAVQTDSPLITKRLHDETSIVDLKVMLKTIILKNLTNFQGARAFIFQPGYLGCIKC